MAQPTEYFKRTYSGRAYWVTDANPTGDVTILLDSNYVGGKSNIGECIVLYEHFTWSFDARLGAPDGDVFDHVIALIETNDFNDHGCSVDMNDPEFLLEDYGIDIHKVAEHGKGD